MNKITKAYKLLKDLPQVKSDTIYWWDDTYQMYLSNGWKNIPLASLSDQIVENNRGWFEEIKEDMVDDFKWTDNLVIDFAVGWCRDRKVPSLALELFKQSKQQLKEKIGVYNLSEHDSNNSNFHNHWYQFSVDKKLDKKDCAVIKQAIEKILNEDN